MMVIKDLFSLGVLSLFNWSGKVPESVFDMFSSSTPKKILCKFEWNPWFPLAGQAVHSSLDFTLYDSKA